MTYHKHVVSPDVKTDIYWPTLLFFFRKYTPSFLLQLSYFFPTTNEESQTFVIKNIYKHSIHMHTFAHAHTNSKIFSLLNIATLPCPGDCSSTPGWPDPWTPISLELSPCRFSVLTLTPQAMVSFFLLIQALEVSPWRHKRASGFYLIRKPENIQDPKCMASERIFPWVNPGVRNN